MKRQKSPIVASTEHNQKKYSYDERCEDLARYFMSDGEDVPGQAIESLAQAIQDAIENWFVGWDPVERRHRHDD